MATAKKVTTANTVVNNNTTKEVKPVIAYTALTKEQLKVNAGAIKVLKDSLKESDKERNSFNSLYQDLSRSMVDLHIVFKDTERRFLFNKKFCLQLVELTETMFNSTRVKTASALFSLIVKYSQTTFFVDYLDKVNELETVTTEAESTKV